jgi:hypothetical protein
MAELTAFELDATDYTESRVADLSPYTGPADDYDVASLESFSEGDIVDSGDDMGVVTGKMTENFEWPAEDVPDEVMAEEQDDDELPTLSASDSEPIYIIALGSGGSKPFHASDLSHSDSDTISDDEADPSDLAGEAEMAAVYDLVNDPYDFDEFDAAVEELQNIPGVDDPEVGFDELPEGWDRTSVLDAWASLGGTWRSCRADMTGEIRSPARFCSALKDEVLGTERWRNRF